MAIVSRHEIKELIERFKAKHFPKYTPGMNLMDQMGNGDTLFEAINPLVYELDHSTGPVSQTAKNCARILKHFNELPHAPDTVLQFNFAMAQARRGEDPTRILKRLRTDYAAYRKKRKDDLKKLPGIMAGIVEREKQMGAA